MPKLTDTQTDALHLIANNPNKVVAVERGLPGYLTINGNCENKLRRTGLIEKTPVETRWNTRYPEPTQYTVYAWQLTDAGRAAI